MRFLKSFDVVFFFNVKEDSHIIINLNSKHSTNSDNLYTQLDALIGLVVSVFIDFFQLIHE